MLVNFDKTELLYLDILATEKLDIVKHRYERDKGFLILWTLMFMNVWSYMNPR